MKYYLGKGTEFKKEDCKEYKTIEGAEKAWKKSVNAGDVEVSVWDENGNLVMGMTNDIPEGALEENTDGTVNVYDKDGNKSGTISKEEVEALTNVNEDEGENAEEKQPEGKENEMENNTGKVIAPEKKMKVTVICDGILNIRRSAEWGEENICGKAIKGQTYYVKEIYNVDGKKMIRTVGDLYLSGQPEHVKLEEL